MGLWGTSSDSMLHCTWILGYKFGMSQLYHSLISSRATQNTKHKTDLKNAERERCVRAIYIETNFSSKAHTNSIRKVHDVGEGDHTWEKVPEPVCFLIGYPIGTFTCLFCPAVWKGAVFLPFQFNKIHNFFKKNLNHNTPGCQLPSLSMSIDVSNLNSWRSHHKRTP